MEHSIERLDFLISTKLDPANTADLDAPDIFINNCIEEADRETEFIRICLFKKSLSIQKEKALLLLVQQCQASITRLLDKVYGYKYQDPVSSMTGLYDDLLYILAKLLNYMEHRFPKYFNKEEKVPDHIVQQARLQIGKEISALEQTIFQSIDPRLATIFYGHLQKFTTAHAQNIISYQKLAYIQELVTGIKSIHPSESECDTNEQFLDLLLEMDFNTGDLLSYCVKKIQSEISTCSTLSLKIGTLICAFQKIRQAQVYPGIAFKPQMKPLKEQIGAWIAEEVALLEMQRSFTVSLPVPPAPTQDGDEQEKLLTSLTVHQLAIFIRAAKDTGLLTNKNQKTVLRTFARVFSTSQVETISAESLRTKYYTPEPGAIQPVKDLLLAMVKKLQTY